MTPYDEPGQGQEAPNDMPVLVEAPEVRGHPVIAWIAIVLITGFIFAMQAARPEPEKEKDPAKKAAASADPVEVQCRYLVGQKAMGKSLGQGADQQAKQQVRVLEGKTFRQRLKVAITAGELNGPDEALDRLEKAERADTVEKLSDDDKRLLTLLKRLYKNNGDPGQLTEEEREFVREELGWFGDLALTPEGSDAAEREEVLKPARAMTMLWMGGVLGGCGGFLLGLALFIIILVALFSRRAASRNFEVGSLYGGIYAETFAIWMFVFVGVMIAGAFLPENNRLLRVSALALSTVCVVAWPVLRGVPWATVRQDLGLYLGEHPFRQIACGPLTYLAALPLVAVGLIITVILVFIRSGGGAGPDEGPTHPIVHEIARADNWLLFQVFFAACVQAPIVEEIFFRGVLYRHLRESTNGGGRFMSMVIAGLISSFVFAVVHPQGAIGVPALMSLALGFCLGREWRGSVVPGMIAHGIHNGLLLLLTVTLMQQ